MKRAFAALLLAMAPLLQACASGPAFDEAFPEADRGTVRMAPGGEALAFARMATLEGPRIVVVTHWQGGALLGVDLSAATGLVLEDIQAFVRSRDYDEIRGIVDAAPPGARFLAEPRQFLLPVDLGSHHAAIGTNYPEHAADAGTTTPFLFPKLVKPTRTGEAVRVDTALLDYEVELGLVPMEPVTGPGAPERLGFVLLNDFTDREKLLRLVDRSDVESGRGFPTAKSAPGYLPVGPLLVVPRDWRSFAKGLELRLYVNDRLRQKASVSDMVWDIDAVFARVWEARGRTWSYEDREVKLFPGEALAPNVMVMTGTPHGTAFDGMPVATMLRGLVGWAASGFTKGVQDAVADAYAAGARRGSAYLKAGDEVKLHVHGLGELVTPVAR